MRSLLLLLVSTLMLMFSCTKDKYIEFKPSLEDTIQWVYSQDLTGTYTGSIANIKWVGNGRYVILSASRIPMVVKELTYTQHSFENITNLVSSSAVAKIFRKKNIAYFYFLPQSMDERIRPEPVHIENGDTFNGVFYADSSYMEYFINYTDSTGSYDQIFQSYRDE